MAKDSKTQITINGAPVVVRVYHGSTAATTRPAGATAVEWVGSVTPTNATDNDTWVDTA